MIGAGLATLVVLVTAAQLAMFVSASVELRRVRRRDRGRQWRQLLGTPLAPRVSVLMPAYNEELTIVESVNGVLALTYPNLEVVVISDGSSDETLGQLIASHGLHPVHPIYQRSLETAEVVGIYRSAGEPRLVVVDKRNGGKADALNCGINLATGDLVCAIDADTLVAPDALQQLAMPFLASTETQAVGGTVRLVNGSSVRGGRVIDAQAPRGMVAGAQLVEYLRAFLVGRLGWNPLGGNLIISGAFGVFRRQSLLDVGGYQHGSIGEDMELVVRLRRRGYERGSPVRVEFTPDPVAWTEAPESLTTLARQRNRWYRGLLDVLVRHRRMLFNPKYRSAGLLSMPYFLLIEAIAPVLEGVGLCLLVLGLLFGWTTTGSLLFVASAYVLGMLATVAVLLFDDLSFRTYSGPATRIRLLGYVVVEQLFLRPLTVAWRLWGLKLFVQGRSEWGAQVRRGYAG